MKKEKRKSTESVEVCRLLLDLIDASPTPFHAVREISSLLVAGGFQRLREEEAWNLDRNGRYFVTRNGSSLVAFVCGAGPVEEAGFKIIGAHTDSPNLRLKPNPLFKKNGYLQLGVEVYGGVLLTTWTDRDLSLAGRVILKARKGTSSELVRIHEPILRIPQLAIHLNRQVNDKGLVLNPQNHLSPILSLAGKDAASEAFLKDLVSRELGCKASEVMGLELSLFDVQKGCMAGPGQEFLFASRLDNLASCHAATLALLRAPARVDPTRVLAFYDNEEVGSESAQGGASPFLKNILERILIHSSSGREELLRAMARSLFISADMAHAVHPNYSEMHDAQHMPMINEGPVVKSHAGQRYATEGVSGTRFELLCQKAGVKVQKFSIRSDLQCGSTIGPITAANLGIRTVDVGNPMLSMHSIREMAGTRDHLDLIRVFTGFFSED
ncbi:MAG: M18 family aminopeptidase [Nitrospinae bacterium CG11_big_fil_rev_8_21_14_0_20_56_8]|nr:MAG: M18 family aminopeptidase [Nitrospinae bacterium CG11_big_fil_rev_8_21_14_0_20_56_8]